LRTNGPFDHASFVNLFRIAIDANVDGIITEIGSNSQALGGRKDVNLRLPRVGFIVL